MHSHCSTFSSRSRTLLSCSTGRDELVRADVWWFGLVSHTFCSRSLTLRVSWVRRVDCSRRCEEQPTAVLFQQITKRSKGKNGQDERVNLCRKEMKEEEGEEVSVLSISGPHALLPESTLVVSFEWAVVQTSLMDDLECAPMEGQERLHVALTSGRKWSRDGKSEWRSASRRSIEKTCVCMAIPAYFLGRARHLDVCVCRRSRQAKGRAPL